MTGTAKWSNTDLCWYVPVDGELVEQLEHGVGPVHLQLKDGQLVVTTLTVDEYGRPLDKQPTP